MRTVIFLIFLLISGQSQADCFKETGKQFGIAPNLLKSIAKHESRMNPRLVMKNSNGSVDVGLMGINSVNFSELKKIGIKPSHLLEMCPNIVAGAYLLTKKIKKYGYTWNAIGAYHSETPSRKMAYIAKIQRVITKEING